MDSSKKGEIASRLILLSPPCELANVVHDVRVLVGDDNNGLMKSEEAIRQYLKDQFTQVHLPGTDHPSILCSHADIGNGRYRCPRTGLVYNYDFSNLEATEIGKLAPDNASGGSITLETWRQALEKELTTYVNDHYSDAAISVFAPCQNAKPCLIACIESHYSKNTTTGRWRSEWTFLTGEHPDSSSISVEGWIRVQTHLYEEGNIQLISSKEIKFEVPAKSAQLFAEECVKKIHSHDDVYQVAIAQNFQAMSDTTLKALRRQLPVTRSKIDWNNINSYQIGHDVSKPVTN